MHGLVPPRRDFQWARQDISLRVRWMITSNTSVTDPALESRNHQTTIVRQESRCFCIGHDLDAHVLAIPPLRDETEYLYFWKALCSPRDGYTWLNPRTVGAILREGFTSDQFRRENRGRRMIEVERRLMSNVLCEPKQRWSADKFLEEFEKMMSGRL